MLWTVCSEFTPFGNLRIVNVASHFSREKLSRDREGRRGSQGPTEKTRLLFACRWDLVVGTGDAGIPTRWWGKTVPVARGEWERATCRALGFRLTVVPAVCERSRPMPMRSCRAVASRRESSGQRARPAHIALATRASHNAFAHARAAPPVSDGHRRCSHGVSAVWPCVVPPIW